jgi:2-polyprenyl-3-methyl-5-hydroxy-6-metoxy-1,4-benzoquinol methylase
MKISPRLIKATIETTFLVVMVLDLIWWDEWYLISLCALYFIYDYVNKRRNAILNVRASSLLREAMTLRDIKEIENRYTALDAFNSPEKREMTRSPLDRYFFSLRYAQSQMLLQKYATGAERVLDLGCGFGINTIYVCQYLEKNVIGLDLDYLKLIEASRRADNTSICKRISFVAGDACHPPFKAPSFDCILMAEVVEHLIRPEEGIRACKELLCDGGILIITTPSRHNLDYSSNPLIALEKILSLISDKVLPPYHNLHALCEYDRQNPEPQYGIHHHFSYQSLGALLRENGFGTLIKRSFEIEIPLFLLIEFAFRGDVERIKKFVAPIETVLERMPVFKSLGQHLVWVARKDGG